jgi:hypothetical protein
MSTVYIIFSILAILCILWILCDKRDKRYSKDTCISIKESMDLCNLPIITMYCGKTKLNFILDTGATDNYIDSSLKGIECVKLNNESHDIIGIGNTASSNTYCTIVRYKDYNFDFTFCFVDLSETFGTLKAQYGVNIHGIISSSFLREHNYIMDFEKLIAYMKK